MKPIGQFKCRILRDAMQIAAQFNDLALMRIDATGIQIRAKDTCNVSAVWIDIPASEFEPEYSLEAPGFETDIGINCAATCGRILAYHPDETIRICIGNRDNTGGVIMIAGATLSGLTKPQWAHTLPINSIEYIPELNQIRSAHPLPASGDTDAEDFREWLQKVESEDCSDLAVAFRHDKGNVREPLRIISNSSITPISLNHPEVPMGSDKIRTLVSLELLQTALYPKCIDGGIKFSFGNDSTLLIDTQVNGCPVVIAIAPRIEWGVDL